MDKIKDVLDIANGVLAQYHIEPITEEEVIRTSEELVPCMEDSAETRSQFNALWVRIQKEEIRAKEKSIKPNRKKISEMRDSEPSRKETNKR